MIYVGGVCIGVCGLESESKGDAAQACPEVQRELEIWVQIAHNDQNAHRAIIYHLTLAWSMVHAMARPPYSLSVSSPATTIPTDQYYKAAQNTTAPPPDQEKSFPHRITFPRNVSSASLFRFPFFSYFSSWLVVLVVMSIDLAVALVPSRFRIILFIPIHTTICMYVCTNRLEKIGHKKCGQL